MDDDLLLRCQRGDAAALGELIRRHQDQLFRAAFRVLRDPGRAEDAVADAFSTIWFRCGNWRGEAAVTWIQRVAYRIVLDHARSRRRWRRLFSPAAQEPVAVAKEPSLDLADRDHQAHRAGRLERAIEALAPEDRILVHLHYFEGQSLAEIAVVLEVSRDALKMRLSRCALGFEKRWGTAMNSPDSDRHDDLNSDPRLSASLRALPIPETPPDLESRVRRCIRRRRIERTLLASGSVLALVVAVLVWHPWGAAPVPVVQLPPPAPPVAQAPPREIPPDELAVLFAPPPVDSLAIVGGRNEKFVAALNRLEDVK